MTDPIEEHIRKAQAEGKFDNLSGKGKPLPLDENPLEDPEWRLANRMIRSSGYTLPWIELRQEIDSETASARADLKRAWDWKESARRQVQLAQEEVGAEWERAVDSFRRRAEKLNKKIFSYNLQTPSDRFQLMRLDIEKEIKSLNEEG